MKLLRETIRTILEGMNDMKFHPMFIELSSKVSKAKAIQDHGMVTINYPKTGCSSQITMSIEETGIYIERLEVVNTSTKDMDYPCFGKEYAKEALSILVDAADKTKTELTLVASPEATGKEREFYELPGKDGLVDLYSRYGFVETSRNFAQVWMYRAPNKNSDR